MSERSDEQAPNLQGLELFEHYEATGAILVVTSDASSLEVQPGDFVVRRPWATAADPVAVQRAAPVAPRNRPGKTGGDDA